MKNLLSDSRFFREEISDCLLPKFPRGAFFLLEEEKTACSFLERALGQPLDILARMAFEANWLAKEQDGGWYEVKDALLRAFVARAIKPPPSEETGILAWGVGSDGGSDVLYIDLIGYGQISFHVFWEDMEGIPVYPFAWTGIRNECFPTFQSLEGPNLEGKEKGEAHNLFVRAGVSPNFLYEEVP